MSPVARALPGAGQLDDPSRRARRRACLKAAAVSLGALVFPGRCRYEWPSRMCASLPGRGSSGARGRWRGRRGARGVFAAAVIRPDTSGVTLPVAVAVFLGIVAAEWLGLDFEFRRHGFSCSASELAFVIALVELGGMWTVLIRAAAFGTVLVLQRFSAPKVLFNVGVAASRCAWRLRCSDHAAGRPRRAGHLAVLPRSPSSPRRPWRTADRGRDHRYAGLSRPDPLDEPVRAGRLVGPSSVVVGLAVLLLIDEPHGRGC